VWLEPSYAILVVVAGSGTLTTDGGGDLELSRGDTVLIPYGAGEATLRGSVEAVRCLPPAVEQVR
jgi:mannose-6-phosphate isomerase